MSQEMNFPILSNNFLMLIDYINKKFITNIFITNILSSSLS